MSEMSKDKDIAVGINPNITIFDHINILVTVILKSVLKIRLKAHISLADLGSDFNILLHFAADVLELWKVILNMHIRPTQTNDTVVLVIPEFGCGCNCSMLLRVQFSSCARWYHGHLPYTLSVQIKPAIPYGAVFLCQYRRRVLRLHCVSQTCSARKWGTKGITKNISIFQENSGCSQLSCLIADYFDSKIIL